MTARPIRCFLAFPLSHSFRKHLRSILVQLQNTRADVKWVDPHHLHLTIKFLGQLQGPDLDRISVLLGSRHHTFSDVTATFNEIGAFPDLHHPQIIWAGLDDPHLAFRQIFTVLEGELAKLGIPQETRSFVPHITLGRIKSFQHLLELTQSIQKIKLEEILFEENFSSIILYKSTLTAAGPIYEAIREYKLKQ